MVVVVVVVATVVVVVLATVVVVAVATVLVVVVVVVLVVVVVPWFAASGFPTSIILQARFRPPWIGDQPIPRPPAIHKTEQTNKELPSDIRTSDLLQRCAGRQTWQAPYKCVCQHGNTVSRVQMQTTLVAHCKYFGILCTLSFCARFCRFVSQTVLLLDRSCLVSNVTVIR